MTGERGFTIMESLVALAVLAITVVALYEAIGTGFRTFGRAAEAEEAVLVAQSLLDGIVASRRVGEIRAGRVEGTRFAWRVDEVKRAAELVTLKLTVSWPGGGKGVAIERLLLVDEEVSR
jgi:prepilin-type N-terminal cleavage/methylation domain-containing protein